MAVDPIGPRAPLAGIQLDGPHRPIQPNQPTSNSSNSNSRTNQSAVMVAQDDANPVGGVNEWADGGSPAAAVDGKLSLIFNIIYTIVIIYKSHLHFYFRW